MEAWGRGIPDIFNECRAAGLPEPEFESIPNFVCLTIRFKNTLTPYLSGELNDELNDELKSLRPSARAIYRIIKKTPGIQRKAIIGLTRLSPATIDRHMAILTQKLLIEHRGSKKTGGYYAI